MLKIVMIGFLILLILMSLSLPDYLSILAQTIEKGELDAQEELKPEFSFVYRVSGGVAGITLSEVSYDSNTKELKFSSRPPVIILGNDTTLIEKTRTLSNGEEQDLKEEILASGFFGSSTIVDPGCSDCYISSLTISLGNNTRTVSWSEMKGVIIPSDVLKTIKAIDGIARTVNITTGKA